LGRAINLAYGLNIPPRQASLIAIRGQCNPVSVLGVVLNDPQYTDWLPKIRDLRGRCQHADVEEVLTTRAGALSRRGEPYAISNLEQEMSAALADSHAEAQEAVQAADVCLDAAIGAILTNPANPLR